jgi:hypothetical protein
VKRPTEIGGMLIDLDEIDYVGEIGGDPAWLRYTVHLKSKKEITLYDKRSGETNYFPRANLLKLITSDIFKSPVF